jgi:hypothetical protein
MRLSALGVEQEPIFVAKANEDVMKQIEVVWYPPIRLIREAELCYACPDLIDIPTTPGLYVFTRVRGQRCDPIYIGLATSLRRRVAQHLNSIKLLTALENAAAGRRMLMVAVVPNLPSDEGRTILASVERALIRQAVADGHTILNKHGLFRPEYAVTHRGNRAARIWLPREMGAERTERRTRARPIGAHS